MLELQTDALDLVRVRARISLARKGEEARSM